MPKINQTERTPKQQLAAAVRSESYRRLVADAAERRRLADEANRAQWATVPPEERVAWLATYSDAHGEKAALAFADSVEFRMPMKSFVGAATQ